MKVGPQKPHQQMPKKQQLAAAETVKTIKTNLMINTKRHLSMSNHFPANSRIFNRSLQELQKTAEVISSQYLAASAVNAAPTRQVENRMPPSGIVPLEQNYQHHQPYQHAVPGVLSPVPINQESNVTVLQDSRGFQPKVKALPPTNALQRRSKKGSEERGKSHTMNPPYPLSRSRSRHSIGSQHWISSTNEMTGYPHQSHPPDRVILKARTCSPYRPPPLSSCLPISQSKDWIEINQPIRRQPSDFNPPPVQVPPMPIKLPISRTSGHNIPNKCLVLNVGQQQQPVIHNKKQILQTVPSTQALQAGPCRRAPVIHQIPMTRSLLPPTTSRPKQCHNCKKLSKYLPFLGYSCRKLLGMEKTQSLTLLVLMCEVCGLFVRESAITGTSMKLEHAAASDFPSFLHNSATVTNLGESQNFIQLPLDR